MIKESAMYYVGVDIAKRSHVACVMRDDNTLAVKPFEFASTQGVRCSVEISR